MTRILFVMLAEVAAMTAVVGLAAWVDRDRPVAGSWRAVL